MEKILEPEGSQPQLEKKRFVLSREKFAKDRLKTIKEEFNKFQQEHPEVLSFNLFGSMSKGYATAESDIDGVLFIDEEKMLEAKGVGLEESKKDLNDLFKKRLVKKLNLDPDSTISILGISKEKIDSELEDLRAQLNFLKNNYPHFNEMDSSWREWPATSVELKAMFLGISLGRDIKKYRHYLLDKLKTEDFGEKIWQDIIGFVRHYERPSTMEHEKRKRYKDLYPQNINNALKYFVKRKPFRKGK